jgi:hypothetical protein
MRLSLKLSFFALLIAIQPASLWADGGTLRLSQRRGDYQVSIFTSPAVLRCGTIDISVLVQNASTGKVCEGVPITTRLLHSYQVNGQTFTDVLEQPASTTAAINKLFQDARFDISQAGVWHASVVLNPSAKDDVSTASTLTADSTKTASQNEQNEPLAFDLTISPPLAAWLELAPWIGWPFAAMTLFLVHQRLASRSL